MAGRLIRQPLRRGTSVSTRARSRWWLLLVIGICAAVAVTGVLAFFLAGAVVFPIVEPHYAPRVLGSLGLMALVYGVESVLGLGVIETCGFVSGNCSQHDLRAHAAWLWCGLVLLALVGLVAWLLIGHQARDSTGDCAVSRNRTPMWMFGAAAGLAIAAASIGLLLIGTAAVIVLPAGDSSTLQGHPLFVAGWQLIRTSLLAALPLVAVWIVWRPR